MRALQGGPRDARRAGLRESRARAAERRAGDGRVGRVSAAHRDDAGANRRDQQSSRARSCERGGCRRPAKVFEQMRGKLASARLTVHACALAYNDSFSDDEIDATFRQAKALGVTTVSSPLTMAMARRLVPFAQRHQVSVAIHNQVDGNPAGAIDTPALKAGARVVSGVHAEARRRQPHRVEPRRGRRTARVPLARLLRAPQGSPAKRRRQPAVRRRGHADPKCPGRAAVLVAGLPALIEYDYVGLRSSVDELKASLAYCRAAVTIDLVALESQQVRLSARGGGSMWMIASAICGNRSSSVTASARRETRRPPSVRQVSGDPRTPASRPSHRPPPGP